MNERIVCGDCGQVHTVNPSKHEYRPKWCVGCRAVLVAAPKKVTEDMMERIRVAPAELSMAFRAILRTMLGGAPRQRRY